MKIVDSVVSAVFRFDPSHSDVVKWVAFARQVLVLVVISVVFIAGLSAFLSIKQAQSLLYESLTSQSRAVAEALARASFVPLTLEDDRSLSALMDSYKPVEHLGRLAIQDSQGKTLREIAVGEPGGRLLETRVPIVPLLEAPSPGIARSAEPIGYIKVGMRTDWIDRKMKAVALTNVVVSGILVLLVSAIGAFIIGNLIERMRELVGEARLVAEVKRANAELEAFSYTVAHDLRAPVRAIDGFAQALLEGHSDKLDEEGRDFLNRVVAGSHRMGQLINDLLSLSRVTRAVMTRERFDMGVLAREIAAGLKDGQPERKVEFVIANELWIDADPNLIRAALDNLLGNAWKYTRRHAQAKIELSRTFMDGKRTYFVRDDGAGFDMAYANKLFKPFSRLHTMQEFEGTGIGLATVQRIVERHGGRIWAESGVEKGSTFYFTLGERK